MQSVGVEAVVAGLTSFLSSMSKMDDSIKNVGKSGTFLGSVFSTVGSIISGLVGGVFRVLEYTLGNLLASAIQTVVAKVKDFIVEVLSLSNELARLQIMLNGLNMPTGDVQDWAAAMKVATAATQEQLNWLQQLAIAAPFSPGDISEIYVAARAMGLADEEARRLTKDVLEFAAGMGLTSENAQAVAWNLRQMANRGKVTSTELRDLARGAMLPLEDVLGRMANNLGITREELSKLISTAEGVPTDVFTKAFEQMVEEEPRFVGAMGRLGRTFEMATKNLWEFLTSGASRNILLPILNVIGEKVAQITDQFVKFDEAGMLIHTEKWDRMVDVTKRIGDTLVGIVNDLFDFNASDVADGILGGLDSVATWLETHHDDIITWVENALTWLQKIKDWVFGTDDKEGALSWLSDKILAIRDWVENVALPALKKFSDWVTENKPLILEFFNTLGEIISTVFTDLLGSTGIEGESVLDVVKNIMQWVIDHKEDIIKWTELVIKTIAVLTALEIIGGILAKALMVVAAAILIVVTAWGLFWDIVVIVIWILGLVTAPILLLIGLVALLAVVWANNSDRIKEILRQLWFVIQWAYGEMKRILLENLAKIADWAAGIKKKLDEIIEKFKTWLEDIKNKIKATDWVQVGKNMIQGIINGIKNMGGALMAAVKQAALDAYNAALAALGIQSPSKLFMNVGEMSMKGMALGIEKSAGLASDAMLRATSQMAMSGMGMMPSSTTNISNSSSYSPTLNIHTSAPTENIASDFAMMGSMAGI